MIERKAFVMESPVLVHHGSGDWGFWLACSEMALYDFAENLPQVSFLHYEDVWKRAFVSLNTLYDYEEAWLWIYEQLEIESKNIALGAQWNLENE